MEHFSFQKLAEEVLTLEVNTIVKADMSGCKMPSSRREALWGLAGDYHVQLVEYQCREPICWAGAGFMAFLEFYDRANDGIKKAEYDLTACTTDASRVTLREKIMMLSRIKTQSEQLISMFGELARAEGIEFDLGKQRAILEERAASAGLKEPFLVDPKSIAWNNDLNRQQMQESKVDLKLSPIHLNLLRKAWEIGTERVLLQSVIHADGDVTTRIAERFFIQPDQQLLQIHNEAVNTSVRFWSNLVKTIKEMATGLLTGTKRSSS